MAQRSSIMREYRSYFIGIDGHRFIRIADFSTSHSDDTAALAAAKRLLHQHEIELWDRSRLVARLVPDGEIVSSQAPLAPTVQTDVETKPSPRSPDAIFGKNWPIRSEAPLLGAILQSKGHLKSPISFLPVTQA